MLSFYLVMFALPASIILLAIWLAKKDSKGNG
jgi:hypothetical protein